MDRKPLIGAGHEIFERQLAGYFVSKADSRLQLESALAELSLGDEELRRLLFPPVQLPLWERSEGP